VSEINILDFVGYCGVQLFPAQESLIRCAYGLPLANKEQREIYFDCTHRTELPPADGFGEHAEVAHVETGVVRQVEDAPIET
jgi:hypothetical protein